MKPIPEGTKSCPQCGSGQNLAGQDDDFSFTRPSEVSAREEPVVDNFFMSSAGPGSKKGNNCPVCGNPMQFKERVNSYFCSKCKSFY